MDQVAEIREKIDIVTYLGEFLTLKSAGRNLKALCPFHGEKSPSFVISPDRQIWHCFGCGKGGDLYTFVMEYEHIEFPEALRLLAKRAGVELVTSAKEAHLVSQKERLYTLNRLAAEYYHYILTHHAAGKRALSYLQNRGINTKVIETFQLGYAPNTGRALIRYLLDKKKISKADCLDAGLIGQGGRDLYDFFRGRIMFPLIDHRDNVVGFSGRVLDDTNATAKYINTRDTVVYHKRDHFFGINIAKEAIRKENQALLVEGEFDVLSCFQEGVTNVVAVKGTALTDNQVQLLSRFTQKLTICFDGDHAGQEAIKRSLPIIEKRGLLTTVVVLEDAKDPDDAIKTNPFAFKKALTQEMNIYDFLLTSALKTYDVTTPDGKKKIADELLPTLVVVENEIVKEHYMRKLSKALDTSLDAITRELRRREKKTQPVVKKESESTKRSREELLEEHLLSVVIQSKAVKQAIELVMKILTDVIGRDRAVQKILVLVHTYCAIHNTFDTKVFGDSLPKELVTTYDTCLLSPLPSFIDDLDTKEVEKTAKQLRSVYLHQKLQDLTKNITKAEKDGDEETLQKYQTEYAVLVQLLRE